MLQATSWRTEHRPVTLTLAPIPRPATRDTAVTLRATPGRATATRVDMEAELDLCSRVVVWVVAQCKVAEWEVHVDHKATW